MNNKSSRCTIDLSSYPDLVVIYLGMRANTLAGIKTLLGFGPKIASSVADAPDGLLYHENLVYSLFPTHLGMRQYWRDFDSLERWSHSKPHAMWWKHFMRNNGGTAFWHEAYFISGGMEAVYNNVKGKIGFLGFAPKRDAEGSLFSARGRLRNYRDTRADCR